MSSKITATDFIVEEITKAAPCRGPFSLYRLNKTGWTTPDAIARLKSAWRIDPQRISFAGLKDLHAVTIQYFTIHHGPKRSFAQSGIQVDFLGCIDRSMSSSEIVANQFTVVLRRVPPQNIEAMGQRAKVVSQCGFPNYFDDQRFGSFCNGEFPARLMVLGQYELALKMLMTAPFERDSKSARHEKAAFARHWGEWETLRSSSALRHNRELVEFLANRPGDFRGAIHRLHVDLQGLYLAAYQSFIWNRMLASLTRNRGLLGSTGLVTTRVGQLPIPQSIEVNQGKDLAGIAIPLPSARLKHDAGAFWAPLIDDALADQGFSLNEMKLPGLRQPFFSKGDRAAWIIPSTLNVSFADDDHNRGLQKMTLSFRLPRGSYGTMLVKCLVMGIGD